MVGLPPQQMGLEEFLHKQEIGPLSALIKRWTDLDLIHEPRELPQHLQELAYMGMLTCYALRGDERNVRRVRCIARDLLRHDAAVQERVIEEVMDPDTDGNNRFRTLVFKHQDLGVLEDEVQSKIRLARMHAPIALELAVAHQNGVPRAQLHAQVQEAHDRALYGNLSHLLALYIADGRIRKALRCAADIGAIPHHERFERLGHTHAAIDYLHTGGARTLRHRVWAHAPANRYWWRTMIGTPTHQGHLYQLVHESGVEIGFTVLGALALSTSHAVRSAVSDAYHFAVANADTAKAAAELLWQTLTR